MSNSVTETDPSQEYVTAPLSDDEKANIRRFCGYPAYGAGPSGFQGWRFFQAYGLLEYRLGGAGGWNTQSGAGGIEHIAAVSRRAFYA